MGAVRWVLLVVCAVFAKQSIGAVEVVVVTAGKLDYYHLEYSLTRNNFVSFAEMSEQDFLIEGGQFEFEISRATFPIAAPACSGNLLIRMPRGEVDSSAGRQNAGKKHQLYQALLAMYKGELTAASAVPVVLELNPYVERLSRGRYELTACNLFFRHLDGRYIPYTGRLR